LADLRGGLFWGARDRAASRSVVADASERDADERSSPARRRVQRPLWAHVMYVMVQPLDLRAGRLHGVRS
jgi:hypothetical protein